MISIITPTFNEAKNIGELARRVHSALRKDYELIVVDDNSPDRTWEVAKELDKKYHVRVIRRLQGRGLSSAVIEGFGAAKGDIMGVIDADLSHPPELIPKLVSKIKEGKTDFVVASRMVKGGGDEGNHGFKKVISVAAGLLSRPLTEVSDPMSGYFFFKGKCLENARLNPVGYKICLELLVKCRHNKVIEIPYIFMNRSAGESKLSMRENINYLRHLWRLYLFKLGISE